MATGMCLPRRVFHMPQVSQYLRDALVAVAVGTSEGIWKRRPEVTEETEESMRTVTPEMVKLCSIVEHRDRLTLCISFLCHAVLLQVCMYHSMRSGQIRLKDAGIERNIAVTESLGRIQKTLEEKLAEVCCCRDLTVLYSSSVHCCCNAGFPSYQSCNCGNLP